MTHEKKRVGIIGYGVMGEHHARVWSQIPGVSIAAVVDPLIQRKEKAILQYGHECKIFSSVLYMLDEVCPDIVIIATHVPYHFVHTIDAIKHKCHVVCEKPMALSLHECDIMINEAKEHGVKLAIHHQSIFSRAFKMARHFILQKEIGDLQMLRAYGKGRIACSDLMEIGGHLVHGMRYLAGAEVTHVYGDVSMHGKGVIRDSGTQVKDLYPEGRESGIGAGNRMLGLYIFSNGVRGELYLAQTDHAPSTFNEQRNFNFGYYIDIFGSAQRLQLYLPHILFRNRSPLDDLAKQATPWEEVNPDYRDDRDPILTRALAEDFLYAIASNSIPVVSGEDGRMAMEMTLGIYVSHFMGNKSLSIPLEERKNPFETV